MGIWASVGKSTGVQVLVTGTSGLLGLITARLVIEQFGVRAYEQYGLLASLPSLIPFADLGIAAVIVNAVAASRAPASDERVRATITSGFRVLFASAAVITTTALLLLVTGAWPSVLGGGLLPGGAVVATACLGLFACWLPLAMGQRLLVALGRNHVHVATQLVIAPIVLIGVLLLLSMVGPEAGGWIAALTYGGGIVASAIGLVLASRAIHPQVRRALRDVPRLRSAPGVPVLQTAWPMLVQMVTLPIALQSGRVVLSHRGDATELASYNLASQIFTVVIAATGMAGVALWPWFAEARGRGSRVAPWRATAVFGGVGAASAAVLAAVAPWLADLVSDGQITLERLLILSFVVFLTLQAAKYPVGMYMTDAAGLRFQVVPVIIMVPLTVGLSWVLVPPLGAAGPVIAASTSVLLCQIIPNSWWARRDARAPAAPARSPA